MVTMAQRIEALRTEKPELNNWGKDNHLDIVR